MSDVAFDNIKFGMEPEEITEILIENDIRNKPMLENNRDFSKPLSRKVLGIGHSAQLFFNHNKLHHVTFSSQNFSFAHCLQEAEYIFGAFIEHYVLNKPEKEIDIKDILGNYKMRFLQPLIRLRKGSAIAFPIDSPPEPIEFTTKFEVVCNEHAMGKRNFTIVFKKISTHMDITVNKSKSRFSMGRIMNRDI